MEINFLFFSFFFSFLQMSVCEYLFSKADLFLLKRIFCSFILRVHNPASNFLCVEFEEEDYWSNSSLELQFICVFIPHLTSAFHHIWCPRVSKSSPFSFSRECASPFLLRVWLWRMAAGNLLVLYLDFQPIPQ